MLLVGEAWEKILPAYIHLRVVSLVEEGQQIYQGTIWYSLFLWECLLESQLMVLASKIIGSSISSFIA